MALIDNPAEGVDSAPALRETGYVSQSQNGPLRGWSTFVDDAEANPDLKWPRSVPVFNRMRREDAQTRSTLRAVKAPLLSTTWSLEQGAASDEVAAFVSRNLGLPVKGWSNNTQASSGRVRGRFSWDDHLMLALTCLDFGHAVFEQVYRLGDDGRLYLRKLAVRPQTTISEFVVARDGGLVAVVQSKAAATATAPRLPVNRLVVYTNEREGAEWWGFSLLRPAYKHWLLKDQLMRVDALSVDRNGMGTPVHTAPDTGEDVEQQKKHMNAGLKIAADLRSGNHAGVSLAHGAKMQLLGVEGQLPDALKSVLYHDDQIGKSMLAHFLNLGRQTGSWALGTTFQDFFTSALNAVGKSIAANATAHIVEDLVDLNFGPDVPAPRIVHDDLAGQNEALAYAIKSLVDSGVITPDVGLEAFLRSTYRLPATETNREATDDDEAA